MRNRILIFSLASTLAISCLVIALNVLQGYSWREMDWNGDGRTSAGEFLTASEYGKRPSMVGAPGCTEYFTHKDGQLVRIDCF
ncbi:hypothetical protein ACFSM5_18480 [Lacibacterium aquatile]|uniref:EF-hand domain-containing protein n=1 Tax=Lacibacterium aquatile TaxID=1168082 RepID=A0ABW5DYM2_9PROT